MGKIRWNEFIDLHGDKYFFGSSVNTSLVFGPHFDGLGKRLPSPFKLFQEWMMANLKGRWAITKIKGGFFAVVENIGDKMLIENTFGNFHGPVKIGSFTGTIIGYSNSSYGEVARAIGYVL